MKEHGGQRWLPRQSAGVTFHASPFLPSAQLIQFPKRATFAVRENFEVPSTASQNTVHLKSALVVKGAFESGFIAEFEHDTDITMSIDWAPTTVIMNDIAEGARADVVLLTVGAMDELIRDGLVDAATRVPVVEARIGLAIKAGAPKPDISTPEALTQTLLAARSVAYSLGGQSGLHFGPLLEKLGIAEAVNAKATTIKAGFTAEKITSGEADIAVQQISELMAIPGTEVLGPLPGTTQKVTSFSAAIMTGSPNHEAALRFLAVLGAPQATAAFRQAGLDPVTA